MAIKILFFGDIMGKIGRNALKEAIPELKKKYKPDLIVANAENLAHGKGITRNTLQEMMRAGIDFFTSGNHVWKNKEALEIFNENELPIIRPANYPEGVPGDGYRVVEVGTKKVLFVNLMGRMFFLREHFEDPFKTLTNILKQFEDTKLDGIIVDLHAEATSEKNALPRYFDGQVSAVLGTHTHVQTADEHVLPKGTAMISDVGMVGLKYSSLGVDLKNMYHNFLTQMPVEHEMPEHGICQIDGIFVIIKPENRLAKSIERVKLDIEV
jgi:2',3'-cyclic-nucleotide 2'-phosphodiesterase